MIWEALSFKVFIYFNSGSCLVHWSKTFSQILVDLDNMSVKFDSNWLNEIGEIAIYRFFCFYSGSHLVHWSKPF